MDASKDLRRCISPCCHVSSLPGETREMHRNNKSAATDLAFCRGVQVDVTHSVSHNRMVPPGCSRPEVDAMHSRPPVCPPSTRISSPVCGFQRRAVWSELALASV